MIDGELPEFYRRNRRINHSILHYKFMSKEIQF